MSKKTVLEDQRLEAMQTSSQMGRAEWCFGEVKLVEERIGVMRKEANKTQNLKCWKII